MNQLLIYQSNLSVDVTFDIHLDLLTYNFQSLDFTFYLLIVGSKQGTVQNYLILLGEVRRSPEDYTGLKRSDLVGSTIA